MSILDGLMKASQTFKEETGCELRVVKLIRADYKTLLCELEKKDYLDRDRILDPTFVLLVGMLRVEPA